MHLNHSSNFNFNRGLRSALGVALGAIGVLGFASCSSDGASPAMTTSPVDSTASTTTVTPPPVTQTPPAEPSTTNTTTTPTQTATPPVTPPPVTPPTPQGQGQTNTTDPETTSSTNATSSSSATTTTATPTSSSDEVASSSEIVSDSSGEDTAAPPTGFQPCPTNGDPCKILPLGDSITWGINYGGGYRIKLFTKAVADTKHITFVGYDTANPPAAGALSALGDAQADWVPNHEGHSGWTIQQDDDLVTGKSTANNDGVNYSGKKVVADFNPNIVLIHLGTNDMYKGPDGAPDRLGTLIDHVVTDAPDALVVVASIVPFPSGAAAVTTFNAAVPGVVKERTDAGKHVVYVDMFAALTNADLGSDQVHPNEGGYEKMATVWYGAIKDYLH